jgi:hypothetical protein
MGIRQSIIGSAAGLAMALALTSANTASGQQLWTVLPAAGYPFVRIIDLADGNTVVGSNLDSGGATSQAFSWTPQTGRVDYSVNGDPLNFMTSISGDGVYLGGSYVRYRVSDGHVDTIPNPGNYFNRTVKGISGDGSKIMGTATNSRGLGAVTYTWTPQSGTVYLPQSGRFVTGQQTAAGMSRDGSTIVGTFLEGSTSRGFVYREGRGYIVPRQVSGIESSSISCVNADGRVYASSNGGSDGSCTRWLDDVPALLPSLNGYLMGPESISNDGNVVVGPMYDPMTFAQTRSFVWTPTTGTMFVEDYLRMNGISISANAIVEQLLVSGDGNSFSGRFRFGTGSFVATIPSPGGITLVVFSLISSRRRSR